MTGSDIKQRTLARNPQPSSQQRSDDSGSERFARPIQESILALIAYNAEHGCIAANQLSGEEFEGDYRDIATRILNYWKVHKQPPNNHLDDLFAEIIGDKKHAKRPTYIDIFTMLVRLHQDGINPGFVLDRVNDFKEQQRYKAAILQSAELLQRGGADSSAKVRELWDTELRKAPDSIFDPGTRLDETDKAFDFLESKASEFRFGISMLDENQIVPERGEVCLFLGATGMGKSWFLVHAGKFAALTRNKVLHVSLEMPAPQVLMRYLQALFAIPHSKDDMHVTMFDRGEDEALAGWHREPVDDSTAFTLKSWFARRKLRKLVREYKHYVDRVRIKSFASGTLSVTDLRAYLHSLARRDGFQPDMLIVDYVSIMRVDAKKDLRHELRNNLLGLRQLAQEFNLALVTAEQTNREGARADKVRHTHVAEGFALNMDASTVITYSQTEDEKTHDLARLFVAKARGAKDKFGIAIAQNYATGQFCLDSCPADENYTRLIKAAGRNSAVELDPGKLTELIEVLGEGRWRKDNRSLEWAGNAVAQTFGIRLDHKGKAQCKAILDQLVRQGDLVVYLDKDGNREKREYIGPKS